MSSNSDNTKMSITFYKGLTTDEIYMDSVVLDTDDGIIKMEFKGVLQDNSVKTLLNVDKCKELLNYLEKMIDNN